MARRNSGLVGSGGSPQRFTRRDASDSTFSSPAEERRSPKPRAVRTLFLSDIHLGSRNCKATHLLSFLEHIEAERVYLLGDILDLWQLERRLYWPAEHNEVLHALFDLARRGSEVVFVPGNHDAAFRRHLDLTPCGIRIEASAAHELATGRRLLLVHGDELDPKIRPTGALAAVGDILYDWTMRLDVGVDSVRKRLGHADYWSLSAYLKRHSQRAARCIATFEAEARALARERGADGIILGHIHRAALDREDASILYANCGDWVESCTALVESAYGELELIRWRSTARRARRSTPPPALARELLEQVCLLG